MERQKDKLADIMDSEYGLLDKLLRMGALTSREIAIINAENTMFKRNEILMNCITEKQNQPNLLTALSESGQAHVVNWITGNGDYKDDFGLDWPLTEKENECLNGNQETLIDILDTCDLLTRLYANSVISMRQMKFIESKPTIHKKNETLLDIVRRLSRKSYFKLANCLRDSNQSHIGDILEIGGVIVPVHATLESDHLDTAESLIVAEMTNLLRDVPLGRTNRLLTETQMNIIAVRLGQSIVLYICCSKEKELHHLCELIDDLRMLNILEQLFNRLLCNLKVQVLMAKILEKDITKAKQSFQLKYADSRVLKKAVSFRSDLKSRITRSHSNAYVENAISKPVKKTSLTRSRSFDCAHIRQRNNDGMENIRVETAKVFRGLRYTQSVVDRGILEQLHGSITIVLDQISELKNAIQKYLSNQESSQMRTEFGTLHHNLAKLMSFSDTLLLSSDKTVITKQGATDLISSVKTSIQELIHSAEKNAEIKRSQESSSENRNYFTYTAGINEVTSDRLSIFFPSNLASPYGHSSTISFSSSYSGSSEENLEEPRPKPSRMSEDNYTKVPSIDSSHVPHSFPRKNHVQAYISIHAMTSCGIRPDVDRNRETRYPPPMYASSSGLTTLSNNPSEDCGLKQMDQSFSRATLDSGYCSTATINNQAIKIPEGSSFENKVISPGSYSKRSFSLERLTVIPNVADSNVAAVRKACLDANLLMEEEVIDRLVFKQPNEDGPNVRGGSVDVLIVHATVLNQNDHQFQEAFLMTYRTFISPCDLIVKLIQRYNQFSKADDVNKRKHAQNAFTFLIRVVDDLCLETNKEILQILMNLVYHLLNDGELQMASTVRKKTLDKSENYRANQVASHSTTLLSSYKLTAMTFSIIDFKAAYIAEQLTLLDEELFNKIEISEVLRWSIDQSEEHAPNLTKFTEHFSKMSNWCRTHILEQQDPKTRERHLMKFKKVMKHLRRLNNFNSCLAILSAVDSAPVRRLEWQKQSAGALDELRELIDSSSSFRAYRQALAAATPPCIPYIGLVLQDLTFVNIENSDYLPDRSINFSKCWKYFTILQSMNRFRKCNYDFKMNEKIIAFFNNFEYFLSEESLFQLSEMIKPRYKTPDKHME